MSIIFFSFYTKTGSVGPVKRKINLVSPKGEVPYDRWKFVGEATSSSVVYLLKTVTDANTRDALTDINYSQEFNETLSKKLGNPVTMSLDVVHAIIGGKFWLKQ